MVVVSNTSPLSNLVLIGRLDLLREQLGQVTIPPGVRAELTHPSPKSAPLNTWARLVYLLSGFIGSGGPPRYVGLRRFCSVWACLAHCSLYQTNASNTRSPSAKICVPG